jgi:hypothetical protein
MAPLLSPLIYRSRSLLLQSRRVVCWLRSSKSAACTWCPQLCPLRTLLRTLCTHTSLSPPFSRGRSWRCLSPLPLLPVQRRPVPAPLGASLACRAACCRSRLSRLVVLALDVVRLPRPRIHRRLHDLLLCCLHLPFLLHSPHHPLPPSRV